MERGGNNNIKPEEVVTVGQQAKSETQSPVPPVVVFSPRRESLGDALSHENRWNDGRG